MEGAQYTTTTTSPGTSAFMSFLNSWRLSVDLPEAFSDKLCGIWRPSALPPAPDSPVNCLILSHDQFSSPNPPVSEREKTEQKTADATTQPCCSAWSTFRNTEVREKGRPVGRPPPVVQMRNTTMRPVIAKQPQSTPRARPNSAAGASYGWCSFLNVTSSRCACSGLRGASPPSR
jgi:hypothetical protein